jgi:3-hydroxyisobutyrate dehydrogenase-like beta-hydroxyacid dehydrogenase
LTQVACDQPVGCTVLGLKDANLALAAGEAVGVPLPSGNVWRDRLARALADGKGKHDGAVTVRHRGAGERAGVGTPWTSG